MPSPSQRMTNRLRQYNEIRRNGYTVSSPCEFCFRNCLDCVMDARNKNCAECTRRGRKCVREFHSEREWRKLDVERERIDKEIQEAEEASAKIFAKLMRLRRQQKFLKERGSKMSAHDAFLLEQLDDEDPLSAEDLRELERLANEQDAAQLAAVSDNSSLTQMMNSPSFWKNLDLSAGDIPSPCRDNPSNAQ